jgi:hypothetical protein
MGPTGATRTESVLPAETRLERQSKELPDGYHPPWKTIPKIFLRQKINVTTKTTIREAVDGQQRLRTILSFIKDGFVVSLTQNLEYGGTIYSRLPEDIQAQILSYELSVDLLLNLPDKEVLDIFNRLNSYAIVLNEQERINATHFSAFKFLADRIGHKYVEYWTKQQILTARQILRMQEVNLVADLLIAMREGIRSKKRIRGYYEVYERSFDDDTREAEDRFDRVISLIGSLYPDGLSGTEFRRFHLFYSLFTAVAHCLYGLPRLNDDRVPLDNMAQIEAVRNKLDRVGEIFEEKDIALLEEEERQFLQDSRRATTDERVRERRTSFLLKLMK